MTSPFPTNMDRWLLEAGPLNAVVVSSRARLARNLPRLPFAPRANQEQLCHVAERIDAAIERAENLRGFERRELASTSQNERTLLRESHLISTELEKGGKGRYVYLSPAMNASIMVNEEDHLRLSTLVSGMRPAEAYRQIADLEEALESQLELAYSDELGYLTACPTNTGTGLRLSVMLHLPALAMISQVEETLNPLANFGLVVRGAYGEHSEHIGDMFQISNDVTLGKSEAEILQTIEHLVGQVVDRELRAREALWSEAKEKLEDAVCRAVGILSMVRRIDTMEAVALLSRTRLGIGQNWGIGFSHAELSRLFVQIQPAHLQHASPEAITPEARDQIRAAMLREIFTGNGHGGRGKAKAGE